jgi:outer membrane protein
VSEFDDALGGAPIDLPFGKDNTWRAALVANQWLYTGGRLGAGLKTVSAGIRAADAGLEVATADAALNAARVWLDAALAMRLRDIARETAERAEAERARAQLAAELGRASELDALRATVDARNQLVAVQRAERASDFAALALGAVLDIEGAVAAEPLGVEGDPVADVMAALASAGIRAPSGPRRAVAMAEEAEAIARQGVVLARAGGLPTLAATVSAGFTSYPDPLLSLDGDDWNPNLSAGFALTVPIFHGGRTIGDLRRAGADVREAGLRAELAREGAAVEAADAVSSRRAAAAAWEATEGTVEMARRAHALAELRLSEGAGTPIELSDARLLLATALANRALAARDLALAAAVDLLLPALPLAAAPR